MYKIEYARAGWTEGCVLFSREKIIFISLNLDINYVKFTVTDKNLLKSLCNKLNH